MSSETWLDVVQEYFPTATEQQCKSFMWNATCFPFGNKDQIYKNIQRAALESNSNIELAMAQADEVTTTSMRKYHENMEKINDYIAFCKKHFDNAKDEDITRYLWHCTPFPHQNWLALERQIILDGSQYYHDIIKATEGNLVRLNQMLNN